MTRVALLTLSIAIAPALAAAQAPPAPPAPAPAPAPAQAPAVPLAVPAPTAPLPPAAPAAMPAPFAFEPMAPMPPMPIDIDLSSLRDLDIDLAALRDLHVDIPPIEIDLSAIRTLDIDLSHLQSLVGEVQVAQAGNANANAQRQVEIAREAARDAAEQVRSQVRLAGDAYNRGLNALQQRQYDQALEAFDRVIAAKAARADAALYWKAFSEYRLARTTAALQTIAQLQKEHAQSRYLSDARVLETEVRKQSGQKLDPAQLDDDEIKLLAIQGLERTEQVVPLLEGVLNGANSLNVKRRALYVLALRSDPRAREVLLRYAKGGGNPDLQMEAVQRLVSRRDAQTTDAVLRELYESANETAVRRVIIDAYRQRLRGQGAYVGGSASGSGSGAGVAPAGNAAQELTALYQRETDPDLRRHIANVLVSIGSADQVATIVKAERDPQARRRAIGALAVRENPQATRALTDLYGTFTDVETREAIISALANQQNAEALITLARSESNVALKTRIVRHLSEMAPRSQVAADYLMDVIK